MAREFIATEAFAVVATTPSSISHARHGSMNFIGAIIAAHIICTSRDITTKTFFLHLIATDVVKSLFYCLNETIAAGLLISFSHAFGSQARVNFVILFLAGAFIVLIAIVFIKVILVDCYKLVLVVLLVALIDELGPSVLLEDIGDELGIVVPLAALTARLGLAVLLEDVGDELGLVVPLTALAIGSDIGQYLRREDDVIGSEPPPPVRIGARERSRFMEMKLEFVWFREREGAID
jgi:hypothetical protein